MKPRFLTLSALVLVVLGGASFFLSTKKTSHREHSVAAHSSKTILAVNGHLPSYKWPVGAWRMYQFQNNTTLAQEEQTSTMIPTDGVKVTGTLTARVLKQDRGAVYMGMQLSSVAVVVGGVRSDSLEDLLENTVPIGAFLPTGRLAQVIVPDQLEKADKDFLLQLFDLDMALPENEKHEATWLLEEEDVAGTYESNFRFLQTSAIEKQKARYTELATEGYTVEVRESRWTGNIGKEFWLESLEGEEVLSYRAGDAWGATSHLRVQLRLIPDGVPAGDAAVMQIDTGLPLAELLAGVTLRAELAKYAGGAWAAEQEQARRKKYRAMPFSEVRKELFDAVTKMTEHADTVAAIHELRDWLLANPEEASSVAEAVKARPSDEVTARLIHALELAGANAESQDALAAILADKENDPGIRLQAAVASGGLEQLSSESLGEALWNSAFAAESDTVKAMELGDSSLLALGILAEHDTDLSQMLNRELAPYLKPETETHPRDIVTAVRTLQNANTSDTATINRIESLARDHDHPAVRAAAVRFFEQQESNYENVAVEALNDPTERVQIAAVRTLASSPGMSIESVDRLIERFETTDAPETVRGEIALTLGKVRNQHPSANTALEAQLATASPSLKKTIDAVLSEADR